MVHHRSPCTSLKSIPGGLGLGFGFLTYAVEVAAAAVVVVVVVAVDMVEILWTGMHLHEMALPLYADRDTERLAGINVVCDLNCV